MNEPRRSPFTIIALACAMALALVACGGDDASTSIKATVTGFRVQPDVVDSRRR